MSSSDGSSPAAEIPFRKKPKSPAKKAPVAPMHDEEDEDMEEDEYAVEKILAHRFDKRVLKLRVKWQGYPESDSTWEPEENLEGCEEELASYFNKIGGRPLPPGTSPAREPNPMKKRKISSSAADLKSTPTPSATSKPGRKKVDSKTPNPAAGIYPEDSWEDSVLNVDTMEKDDETGRIFAYIVWKDNAKTRHPTDVVYRKCPQKCLQFYEAHLQFHSPAPKPTTVSDAGPTSKREPVSTNKKEQLVPSTLQIDDDDEDEDAPEIGVKGVASSIA